MIIFEIPHETAKTSIETIQDMKHYISTVHGVSELMYGGPGTEPDGLLQGNGFAAQMWAALSSLLFDIFEREGYGTHIISTISKRKTTLAGMAFVDDTDIMDIARGGESEDDLIERTQNGLKLWNELIEVTGGALEPTKTDWCIVSYEKCMGQWIESSGSGELTLIDEYTNNEVKLKPAEARRTLGIWQAGDGNQKKQVEILIENIQRYGKNIKGSGLSRREKEIALKATISRTIAYGAPATTLSKNQSDKVNKELRKAVIQGLGLAASTPTALIHGPKSINGLEILDYYTLQLIEHIKILMNHLDTNTRTNELLANLVEQHTLELGSEKSIWSTTNNKQLCMMSRSWIKNTLIAMNEHQHTRKQIDF
jgi:hypothetical protein